MADAMGNVQCGSFNRENMVVSIQSLSVKLSNIIKYFINLLLHV